MGAQDMSSPRDKSRAEKPPFMAARYFPHHKNGHMALEKFGSMAAGETRLVRFSFRDGGSVSMATRHVPMLPIPLARGTRNFCLRIGFIIVATWPLLLALVLLRVLLVSIF